MAKLPAKWRKLLLRIPDYDPFRDAGDCVFSVEEAENALDFMSECVRHVKGARAGDLLVLEPWQQSIIANLFGWLQPDGWRRYRECLLFVPRKNGKTFLAAAAAVYVMVCDGEMGAEAYACAGDREQATLCHSMAWGIMEQDDWLRTLAREYRASKTIEFFATNSTFKAISKAAGTKHGGNTHFAVVDELHVQPDATLVDVIRTSMSGEDRKQPLLFFTTTSDYERPSICNETYDYACKVRDGIIKDATFLPVIYEAPKDADWTDRKTWRKANPNLSVSVSLPYLIKESKRAREQPSYENTFKRLHLNIRTEQLERWLQMEAWDSCPVNEDIDFLLGQECYGALDASSTTDLTSLALVFPQDDGFYDALVWFWVPGDNAVRREHKDRVPYTQWAREGWLETTEGNVVDQDVIRRRINEIGEQYNILELAIDRWNTSQITTQLMGDGFDVIPFGQGFASMSAPTKELEVLVVSGKLRTDGNPVLRWNASNVSIQRDAADNMKPAKDKSTEKIDGIVALIMALGRAIVRDENEGRSVYDERGVVLL